MYGVRCSVKFDAWEETYDVARLDAAPKTPRQSLKQFRRLWRHVPEGRDTRQPRRHRRPGGAAAAPLVRRTWVIKQTSIEEASKIKDWLVQQQSGVMQSLFSHMLGELTLNQTLKVRISVPTAFAANRGETRPTREKG